MVKIGFRIPLNATRQFCACAVGLDVVRLKEGSYLDRNRNVFLTFKKKSENVGGDINGPTLMLLQFDLRGVKKSTDHFLR